MWIGSQQFEKYNLSITDLRSLHPFLSIYIQGDIIVKCVVLSHGYVCVSLLKWLLLYVYIVLLLQAGLTKLESLNLDSCRIGDEGLVNLIGYLSTFFL